jgi:hypothetical protein
MGSGSGDIIIKGGSVAVEFDDGLYPKDPKDPSSHKSETRRITRIVITGDVSFDSGELREGLRFEVKASTT